MSGAITVTGPAAEKLIQARKNYDNSKDQLLRTRKKAIDSLHEQKRAEAALEEVETAKDCRTYWQAGRAFLLVPRDRTLNDLKMKAQKNKSQREQLAELEKALAQRAEQYRAVLLAQEEEIKNDAIMQRNAVQAGTAD